MSKLKKFVYLLFTLVIIIPLFFTLFSSFIMGDIHDKNIDTTSLEDFSHRNETGIKNILIMGTDARPGDKISRTDSMMILTIDKVHKDIKLTSLARDTLVNIPGHGKSKLTHAYAFGKEGLLIKTIENNFDIDINDFVLINFDAFMGIVDSVGGVEVEVTLNEVNELNKFIPETYKWDKNPDKGEIQYIKHTGLQTLNGYQALSFARIRHNDSAFNRDNRQRMVMMSIMKKIQETSKFRYPFIFNAAKPYIKTNIATFDLFKYLFDVMSIGTKNIKQMEFPLVDNPKYAIGGIYGRHGWVVRFKPSSVNILKAFIFDDVNYK